MRYLTTFLLIISPFVSIAQISENVNKQLPDSLKPADINNISYQEAEQILRYAAPIRFESENENNQIEQLCTIFTPLFKHLKTNDEKLYHLIFVSTFWHYRYGSRKVYTDADKRMLDSSLKYVEMYRKYITKSSKKYENHLAQYYGFKGNLMNTKKQYTIAYANIQQALEIYKMKKDSVFICVLYRVLSNMHNELELYPQTIMFCDSALLYAINQKTVGKNPVEPYSYIITRIFIYKAYAFCSLYAATRIKQHRDSVISNVNKLVKNTNVSKYRSTAFDILARLNYHQGNYIRSISFTDSSLALSRGKELNEDQINSLLFKALCLIKIGKKEEGLNLIKKNEIQGSGPEAGKILEELYKSEKEKGNLRSAILYLERFQKFQDSSRSLKARGQIFEIQQKYDVASKDLHIFQLRENEKKGKLIAGGVGLVVCFAGLLFGIRFRNNQKKTRVLVDQINELTELQILRIEDEKEKERRRIGQELHDDLSGTIAAGVRYLRMMAEDESKSESKIRLSEISDMLEKGYDKARGKSHELYLEENDENFWKGLGHNVDLFFAATDIKVSLGRETSGLILPLEVKTTILLIIKESITNVIKHSKASEVEILIYAELEKLMLEVSDNGKGMFPGFGSKNVGLKSINERVSKLNGTMKICARNPSGMNLKVEIPVSEQLHSYEIHS